MRASVECAHCSGSARSRDSNRERVVGQGRYLGALDPKINAVTSAYVAANARWGEGWVVTAGAGRGVCGMEK